MDVYSPKLFKNTPPFANFCHAHNVIGKCDEIIREKNQGKNSKKQNPACSILLGSMHKQSMDKTIKSAVKTSN